MSQIGVDFLIRDSSFNVPFSLHFNGLDIVYIVNGVVTTYRPGPLTDFLMGIDVRLSPTTVDARALDYNLPGQLPSGPGEAMIGTQGNDIINGRNFITGPNVEGYLFGGVGNDVLNGAANTRYVMEAGAGNDRLNGTDLVNDLQYGGSGNDRLDGKGGNDRLFGGFQDDMLFGGNGNDTLWGGGQNDTLSGGAGFDVMNGGAGNDILNGSTGNDTMTGGVGADDFVYTNINSGRDTITDFALGVDSVVLNDTPTTTFSILQQAGGSLVTINSSGTQIFFTALQATTIQSNINTIFDLNA